MFYQPRGWFFIDMKFIPKLPKAIQKAIQAKRQIRNKKFEREVMAKIARQKLPSTIEEISGLRREESKTFLRPDGKLQTEIHGGAIHYKNDYKNNAELWKDIDLQHVVETPEYFEYDRLPAIVRVYKKKVGYETTSRRTGHKIVIELEELKNKKVKKNEVLPIIFETDEFGFKRAKIKDYKGDPVDFDFQVMGGQVRLWKHLKSENAPKEFKWRISEENKPAKADLKKGDLKFKEEIDAFDIADDKRKYLIGKVKTKIDDNSFYWQETAPKTGLSIDADTIYSPLNGQGSILKDEWSWDACHDATAGGSMDVGGFPYGPEVNSYSSGARRMIRNFFPFLISALPPASSMSNLAGTFQYYNYSVNNYQDNDDEAWVNLVGPTTQADPTTLATGDFDQCGAIDNPTEFSTRVRLENIGTGWKTFTLNSTALALIDSAARSYLLMGQREGHDALDIPILAGGYSNSLRYIGSGYSGTSFDPKIVLTYNVTLYWVGGSGNWTDPSHWAYTSGGTGGTVIPSSSASAVFDENSFPTDPMEVDQFQRESNDYGDIGKDSGQPKLAQAFQVSKNGTLGIISMQLYKENAPTDNLVCKIYSDSGGVPNTLLATSDNTINGAKLTTTPQKIDFTFYTSDPSVSTGTTYWAVIERSGAVDATNYYHVRVYKHASTNYYANGDMYKYDGANWVVFASGYYTDMVFDVWLASAGNQQIVIAGYNGYIDCRDLDLSDLAEDVDFITLGGQSIRFYGASIVLSSYATFSYYNNTYSFYWYYWGSQNCTFNQNGAILNNVFITPYTYSDKTFTLASDLITTDGGLYIDGGNFDSAGYDFEGAVFEIGSTVLSVDLAGTAISLTNVNKYGIYIYVDSAETIVPDWTDVTINVTIGEDGYCDVDLYGATIPNLTVVGQASDEYLYFYGDGNITGDLNVSDIGSFCPEDDTTLTVGGNITMLGDSLTNLMYVYTQDETTPATLVCDNTVTAQYLNLTYSTASGDAEFRAVDSVDGGNNSGWFFTKTAGASGSEGPSAGDTAASDDLWDGVPWTNPGDALTSNDQRASLTLNSDETEETGDDYSELLKITGFGFDIPAGAEITGIEISTEGYQSASNGGYWLGPIYAGIPSEEDYFNDSSLPEGSEGVDTIGGPTFMGHLTSPLTPAIVNNSGFGIMLGTYCWDVTSIDFYIDQITVTIYYLDEGAGVSAKTRIKHSGETKSVSAKARILKVQGKTVSSKVRIFNTLDKTVSAKTRVKKIDNEATASAKTRIKQIDNEATASAKTRIKSTGTEKTVSAKSRIKNTLETSIQAKARIKVTDNLTTVQSKVRIKKITEKTASAKARIKSTGQNQDVQAKTRIKKLDLENSVSAKVRIKKEQLSIVSAKTRILKVQDKTASAKIRIKTTGTEKTISAKTRIKNTFENNVSARVRIKKVDNEKTVSAKTRIFKLQETSASAKTRIKKEQSTTLQAKTRIKNTFSKNTSAKVRVKSSGTSQDVSVKTRIKVKDNEKSLSVLTRIKKTQQKTASAKVRILNTQETNVEARVRIKTTNDTTLGAKARIKRSGELHDVSARTRVKRLGLEQNVSAKTRIKILDVEKTVSARVRIKQPDNINTISARTKILKVQNKTTSARVRVRGLGLIKTLQARVRIKQPSNLMTVTARARIKKLFAATIFSRVLIVAIRKWYVKRPIEFKEKLASDWKTKNAGGFSTPESKNWYEKEPKPFQEPE